MLNGDYPALWQLLGGYFHQDWDFDYASPEEALEDFFDGQPVLAPKLADEIERVLALEKSDDELDALILEFGSSYLPTSNGVRSQTWLSGIRDLARSLPQP